jgi:hypothetical protein
VPPSRFYKNISFLNYCNKKKSILVSELNHQSTNYFSENYIDMNAAVQDYNNLQSDSDKEICNQLATIIDKNLPDAENKIWHAHPVWFLDGNPIVGYSTLKNDVRLLFWSGQSFEEEKLTSEGSFKAADFRYTSAEQIIKEDMERWLKKGRAIQWDYKNIVKRKGVLERLK